MKFEYEVKLLDINVEHWKKKLLNAGGIFIGEHLQKITIFSGLNGDSNEYVRVRDEGFRSTLTHKVSKFGEVVSRESEIAVSSYEKTVRLLIAIGLNSIRVEEKLRASFKLGKCTVDIDTWPRIPPYVEIEANSEIELLELCKLLSVDYDSTFKGSALDVLKNYNIDASKMDKLVF